MQVREVLDAALGEVDVGLQRDAARRRRPVHQVGVGRLFPAHHHGRHPAGGHRVDTVLPGAVAAEDAHDDDVGAGQQLVELTVDKPRRVGPPIARPLARAVIRSVSEVDSSRTVVTPIRTGLR